MGANGRLRKREGENTDAAPLMRETVHLAWIMLLLVGIPPSWKKKQANCSQKKNRLCRTDGMSVNPARRRDKELGTDRYLLLFSPTNNWDSFFSGDYYYHLYMTWNYIKWKINAVVWLMACASDQFEATEFSSIFFQYQPDWLLIAHSDQTRLLDYPLEVVRLLL